MRLAANATVRACHTCATITLVRRHPARYRTVPRAGGRLRVPPPTDARQLECCADGLATDSRRLSAVLELQEPCWITRCVHCSADALYLVPVTGSPHPEIVLHLLVHPPCCPSCSALQASLDVLPSPFVLPRRAQLVPFRVFAASRARKGRRPPKMLSKRPPTRTTRCSRARCARLAAGMEAPHASSPPPPTRVRA